MGYLPTIEFTHAQQDYIQEQHTTMTTLAEYEAQLEAVATDPEQPSISRAIAIIELDTIKAQRVQMRAHGVADWSHQRSLLLENVRPSEPTVECRPAPSCTYSSVYIVTLTLSPESTARRPRYTRNTTKLY